MIDTVLETLYMYYSFLVYGLVQCCICNNMDVQSITIHKKYQITYKANFLTLKH